MMQLLSFDDERFESALDAIVGRAETPPAGIE